MKLALSQLSYRGKIKPVLLPLHYPLLLTFHVGSHHGVQSLYSGPLHSSNRRASRIRQLQLPSINVTSLSKIRRIRTHSSGLIWLRVWDLNPGTPPYEGGEIDQTSPTRGILLNSVEFYGNRTHKQVAYLPATTLHQLKVWSRNLYLLHS